MPDLKREEATRSPSYDKVLSSEKQSVLRRRNRYRAIANFVAFCLNMILLSAILFSDLSEGTTRKLAGVAFASVIVMGVTKFSKQCSKCGANIGWHIRLGMRQNCKKCGAYLGDEK